MAELNTPHSSPFNIFSDFSGRDAMAPCQSTNWEFLNFRTTLAKIYFCQSAQRARGTFMTWVITLLLIDRFPEHLIGKYRRNIEIEAVKFPLLWGIARLYTLRIGTLKNFPLVWVPWFSRPYFHRFPIRFIYWVYSFPFVSWLFNKTYLSALLLHRSNKNNILWKVHHHGLLSIQTYVLSIK